jgi:hypothetical protein
VLAVQVTQDHAHRVEPLVVLGSRPTARMAQLAQQPLGRVRGQGLVGPRGARSTTESPR